jgi:hypothetical protein
MGEGTYAHRCTHGGPPRPHLILQGNAAQRSSSNADHQTPPNNHHQTLVNHHHQTPANNHHKSPLSSKGHHQTSFNDHLAAITKKSYQARVMSRLQDLRGADPAAGAIHQAAIAKNYPLVFLSIAQYRARVISRLQLRFQSPPGANVGQGACSSLKLMSRQRKRKFTKCSFMSALPCNGQNKQMACGASNQRHHREVMVKGKQCSGGAGYPVYRCCRYYGLLGNAISKNTQLMGGKEVRMYPIPALETLLETPGWHCLRLGQGTMHACY